MQLATEVNTGVVSCFEVRFIGDRNNHGEMVMCPKQQLSGFSRRISLLRYNVPSSLGQKTGVTMEVDSSETYRKLHGCDCHSEENLLFIWGKTIVSGIAYQY